MLPEGLLEIPNVTARLGVSSYKLVKLKEILQRYPEETAVTNVRSLIMQSLDLILEIGQREGGNCIISWDSGIWGWTRWSLSESS